MPRWSVTGWIFLWYWLKTAQQKQNTEGTVSFLVSWQSLTQANLQSLSMCLLVQVPRKNQVLPSFLLTYEPHSLQLSWNSKTVTTKLPHYILSVNNRLISYFQNFLWNSLFPRDKLSNSTPLAALPSTEAMPCTWSGHHILIFSLSLSTSPLLYSVWSGSFFLALHGPSCTFVLPRQAWIALIFLKLSFTVGYFPRHLQKGRDPIYLASLTTSWENICT